MALIAMCSAKGSPGVTTAALAFGLTWSRRTILAECDPAGGDVLAGYLQSRLPADRGLEKLAVADLRDRLAQDFWSQLYDLDTPHGRRLLLPGLKDPARGSGLEYVWPRLGAHLAGLESGEPAFDVIADCGRLVTPNPPTELIRQADVVLLVLRTTMPSLSAGVVAARALRDQLADVGGDHSLGLLLINEGTYRAREVRKAFNEADPGLDVRVVAELPYDPAAARGLNLDGQLRRGGFRRAAAQAEAAVVQAVVERRGHYHPQAGANHVR